MLNKGGTDTKSIAKELFLWSIITHDKHLLTQAPVKDYSVW